MLIVQTEMNKYRN